MFSCTICCDMYDTYTAGISMRMLHAGYGTYVVASLTPLYGCWASDHRRNLTRILVYVSWAMIMIFDWYKHETLVACMQYPAAFLQGVAHKHKCTAAQLAHFTSCQCCRGRLLILYNIAPDLQRTSSWAWRIRLLAWLTGSKDLIQRLQSNE